jgi:hypothetical protein
MKVNEVLMVMKLEGVVAEGGRSCVLYVFLYFSFLLSSTSY